VEQIAAMKSEANPSASVDEAFAELRQALVSAAARIRAFAVEDLVESRAIGRQQMPTTLGGLLVHVADHTQRHVGQAITTAKIVKSNLSMKD
ncbi:MAG TPA: DinB family protein, partial [Terriglobales bacterium]